MQNSWDEIENRVWVFIKIGFDVVIFDVKYVSVGGIFFALVSLLICQNILLIFQKFYKLILKLFLYME